MLKNINTNLLMILIITLLGSKSIVLYQEFVINQSALQVFDLTKSFDIMSEICNPSQLKKGSNNESIHKLIAHLQTLENLAPHQAHRYLNLIQTVMNLEPVKYRHDLQAFGSSKYDLLRFRAGLTEYLQGDTDRMIQIWEPIKAGNWALSAGDKCQLLGKIDLAKTWYQIAVETSDDPQKAYFTLGLLYYKMGDYDSAIQEFFRSLTSGYEEQELFEYAGAALIKTGREEEAIEVLQKGLEIHPTSIKLLYWYAGAMYIRGQFDESTRIYELVLEFDPEDIYANLGLAKVYLDTGSILAGQEKLNKVLEIIDESPPLDVCNSLNSMIISITDIHLAARITQICGQTE